jgi:hypothetical protein
VIGMLAIEAMRARVESTQTLPETLAAGWDAFELMRAVADGCADGDDGSFAAFLLAGAAAANGRDAVGLAPSLAAGQASGTTPQDEPAAPAGAVAAAIAALAAVLGPRLSRAADGAADPADRAACQRAGAEAARIRALLGEPG